MKTILLHIYNDDGQEARLLTAIDLARVANGHIVCLQIMSLSAYVVTPPFGGLATMGPLYEVLDKENRDERVRLEARLKAANVTWDWLYIEGGASETIISQSRLADIVVLSQRDIHNPDGVRPLPVVADVAIHARTPVLAVPDTYRLFDPTGTVMIAWNGSAEAAHAMRFALPLLHRAKAVHIVVVGQEDDLFTSAVAASYLARHGIKSAIDHVEPILAPVGETLSQTAILLGASYLVMGAYGHSRFREAILGGVTRQLLSHCSVLLLLGH